MYFSYHFFTLCALTLFGSAFMSFLVWQKKAHVWIITEAIRALETIITVMQMHLPQVRFCSGILIRKKFRQPVQNACILELFMIQEYSNTRHVKKRRCR